MDVTTLLEPDMLTPGKFAVGQPVSRREDPVLLRGEGNYTADKNLPGQAYMVVVRSRVAHGILRSLDVDAALAVPGVLKVITVADLKAAGIKPMQNNVTGTNHDGSAPPKPVQYALAEGRVRYVGEPLAVVVGETLQQARDGAEALFADIDPLLAVTTAEDAAAPGAPQLYDEAPGNVVLDWHFGQHALVDEIFAKAAHVTRMKIRNSRVIVSAMEPRAILGLVDGERYIVHSPSQGAFGLRAGVARMMGVPAEQVRGADRQCRRKLWHEGRQLPGTLLRAAGGARAGAAGEMGG